MGFRKDTYATVWSVEPISDTITKARISISRKNRNTDEYETDFSGFVKFMGTSAARKASTLSERSRIKLGDVDVSNRYDKEKGITYTDYKVFSFDEEESSTAPRATVAPHTVDDGEVDDDRLPF